MTRWFRIASLTALSILIACSSGGDAATHVASAGTTELRKATPPTHLTIHTVTDTHAHLEAFGPKTVRPDGLVDGTIGGMAKAAYVIQQLRAAEPDALLLHAGDLFDGDLFFNADGAVHELKMMNQLGFDAMVLGNHDLFYGTDVLAASLAAGNPAGKMAVLSANLVFPDGGSPLAALVRPSIIKDVRGVKVGIFGATLPWDPFENPAPAHLVGSDGDVEALFATMAAQVATLRASGADVVICLSHLGANVDEQLAAALHAAGVGVDAIVGGHDHNVVLETVDGTVIVHPGEYYRNVGRLTLKLEGKHVAGLDDDLTTLFPLDADTPTLPSIKGQVQGLEDGVDLLMQQQVTPDWSFDTLHQPVASATVDLDRTFDPASWRRDTGVGDFITDALRTQLPGAQLGLIALGVIDDKLWAGPLTADDLFRPISYSFNPALYGLGAPGITMMPVDVFTIAGQQLWMGIEYGLDVAYPSDPASGSLDFFPQVSGALVVFDSTRLGLLEAAATGQDPTDTSLHKLLYVLIAPHACAEGEQPPFEGAAACGDVIDPGATYQVGVNYAVVEGFNMILSGMGAPEIELPAHEPPNHQFGVVLQHAMQLGELTVPPLEEARIIDVSLLP